MFLSSWKVFSCVFFIIFFYFLFFLSVSFFFFFLNGMVLVPGIAELLVNIKSHVERFYYWSRTLANPNNVKTSSST